MKFLVTGADGFIGSHLVEALVKKGHKVKAFVLYNSLNSWGWLDKSDPKIVSEVEIFSGDIRDPHGVKEGMKGCDIVIHLAALIGIPFSFHSPDSYVDTNIKGTLNILQAAKELNVQRIIHTSTSEVYGSASYVPIDETHPLQGQSPYSATKIAADQLAFSFYTSFGLPVVIARPFNTYGPRQSLRAVIPSVICQIASGKRELNLGALEPTRDFSYIDDTVNAFEILALSDQGLGEVYNFGSNYEISINNTVQLIAKVMNVQIQVTEAAERIRPKKSEVQRLWSNNAKFRKDFNWSPDYAGLIGLEKGLEKTAEWLSNPINLSNFKAEIYNF